MRTLPLVRLAVSAAVVAARVLAALRAGEIVLMRVGSNLSDHTTFDADALPHVISELHARGYSFEPSTRSCADHPRQLGPTAAAETTAARTIPGSRSRRGSKGDESAHGTHNRRQRDHQ